MKWALTGVACLILLSVVAVALLPSSFWRGMLVRSVSQRTGREATIDGDVRVRIFSLHPQLIVEGFTLTNAGWAQHKPMLQLRRADITLRLASLFHGELTFDRIAIDGLTIDFERESSGRANWDFSTRSRMSPAKPPPLHVPVVRQLTVTGGTVSVTNTIRKLNFDGTIAVDEEPRSPDSTALNLRGTGTLNDKPFDVS